MIITIDGPAGSGKSTVARLLAKRLGAGYLDTGAMYRAVTLAAINAGVDMGSDKELLGVLRDSGFRFSTEEDKMCVSINGVDVTEQIRSPEVTDNVHYVASSAKMRAELVRMQREFASGYERLVAEGRDQGTVVFPEADVKFYLTAGIDERARRRQLQMQSEGIDQDIKMVLMDITVRDKSDENRGVGPMKPATGAININTTGLSIKEVVEKLLDYVDKDA